MAGMGGDRRVLVLLGRGMGGGDGCGVRGWAEIGGVLVLLRRGMGGGDDCEVGGVLSR